MALLFLAVSQSASATSAVGRGYCRGRGRFLSGPTATSPTGRVAVGPDSNFPYRVGLLSTPTVVPGCLPIGVSNLPYRSGLLSVAVGADSNLPYRAGLLSGPTVI